MRGLAVLVLGFGGAWMTGACGSNESGPPDSCLSPTDTPANTATECPAPIHALADVVTDRALTGPTELTTDELATLLPTPPDPSLLLGAQRMLQQVGITWPGSPERD